MLKNEYGEFELSKKEVGALSHKDLAKALRECNRWRRAKGKYQWSEEPRKNVPPPYSPSTTGYLMDEAVKRLLCLKEN